MLCSRRDGSLNIGIRFIPADPSTSNLFSSLQDALFFLKDYFSNLASYVNPYLPVDPASEGEIRFGDDSNFSIVWCYDVAR